MPGASERVFLPLILKSCEILPLFWTVKMIVPVGALLLENVYLNSNAFTVTFVIAAAFFVASTLFVLAPPDGRKTPANTPASASAVRAKTPVIRLI